MMIMILGAGLVVAMLSRQKTTIKRRINMVDAQTRYSLVSRHIILKRQQSARKRVQISFAKHALYLCNRKELLEQLLELEQASTTVRLSKSRLHDCWSFLK